MEALRRIFGTVDRGYLLKSYILSVALTALLISGGEGEALEIMFAIVSGILFPFSALVWDSLIGLMTGGTFFIMPLPVMLAWKIIKIVMLYIFAVVIAPVGMIYAYIRGK